MLHYFPDFQAARTDSERPRSSIWLRMLTAIRVSCAGRVCERKVSPMMGSEEHRNRKCSSAPLVDEDGWIAQWTHLSAGNELR